MNDMNEKIRILCERNWEKAKKKPYLWATVICLLVLVVFPLAIWIVYCIGDWGWVLIETSLDVGDALGFYSSVLASVATAALGAIAVLQNTRLQKLESDVAAKNNSCNVYVKKNTVDSKIIHLSHDEEMVYKESDVQMEIEIKNLSEAFLKNISIKFGDTIFSSHITLTKDESKYVRIFLPEGFSANTLPVCQIVFTSCYDVKTYGDFKLQVTDDPWRVEIKYYHFYGTTKPKI